MVLRDLLRYLVDNDEPRTPDWQELPVTEYSNEPVDPKTGKPIEAEVFRRLLEGFDSVMRRRQDGVT